MIPVQDHKQALDGDEGPNTGGMGCYAPVGFVTPALYAQAVDQILRPAVDAIRDTGIPYKGVLYAGIMITNSGQLKTLEFNCRFGDPETQVLLPRLESDLVDLLDATIDGTLSAVNAKWKPESAVCVVLASGGYPGSYATGKPITGLDGKADGITVFHAGTRSEDGRTVTSGGRVLGVTALAADLATARARAYAAVEGIDFEGRHFRRDIAAKGLTA